MMKRRVMAAALSVMLVMGLVGCTTEKSAGKESKKEDGKTLIAQSMPTLNNPWYVEFAEGSKDMAEKLGAELLQVTNPETNAWSPETQISKIENLIAKNPDVIEIDPTSTDGINGAVDEARKKGIPVVVSGTKVSTEMDASIIGDNAQGGELAGAFMGKALDGKGKVAVLLGTPGRDVFQAREDGFKKALKEFPDITIAAEQIANSERAEAVSVTETILQANPDIDAIWASNDEMALGAVEALRSLGKAGKVIVGGFDATPDAVTAIQKEEMHFSVNQIPYEMGVRAIAIATLLAQGKDIPAQDISLELSLVSYENVKEYLDNQEQDRKAVIDKVMEEYQL